MSIRTVCFDFQDTLAYMEPTHFGLYVQAAAEHGIDVDEDSFVGTIDGAWSEWQTPLGIDHSSASTNERTFRSVRAGVHRHRLQAAGIENSIARPIADRITVLEADPQYFRLFEDTMPCLVRLSEGGINTMIVSNHVWQLPAIVESLELPFRPDAVLTSSRIGYRKPHPQIYAFALQRTECLPAEVLFVGDSVTSDVEGPRAAGMHSLLLDRIGTNQGTESIRTLAELTP